MISFLTPLATAGISYASGFVLVGTNLAAFFDVYFFLSESVSLSLENVDKMYSQPELKPWTSHKWVPEGYITRMQRDEAYFHRHGRGDAGSGDDGETAVGSGRPSGAEKKGSGDLGHANGGFGTEEREERVNRAV
jgi:SP family sugar:H+ symporter-like MFS transporter